MDVDVASDLVARLAARRVSKYDLVASDRLVVVIVARLRKAFEFDPRSMDALERARRDGPVALAELASALARYARRDQAFADELTAWAAQADPGLVIQHTMFRLMRQRRFR